jgi:ketosteroid isomerase-like protein
MIQRTRLADFLRPPSGYILNLLKESQPMRTSCLPALIVFVVTFTLSAQSATPEAQAIRAVLDKQVVDWNRGDLETFATGYKNSPDILFIGSKISRGYAQMLDTYRKGYSTKEKMGTLSFSELEVQPLDEHFATVTGHFHLERTAAGGGNADGHFLLVFEKTPAGWKIVRDDTTVPPKKTCE